MHRKLHLCAHLTAKDLTQPIFVCADFLFARIFVCADQADKLDLLAIFFNY